jgi:hypothetical protein
MSILPLPALALYVLMVQPRVLLRVDVWGRAILALIIGISFNLFLPIRAELDPVINEGDPVCETAAGAVVAVYTQGRTGCEGLGDVLVRRQYAKPSVTLRQAPLGHQLLNYFQYFDWQWSRGVDPDERPGNARLLFTLLFIGLGAGGLWVVFHKDRAVFSYVAVLMLTLTVGLVFYLNFRFGFSLAPEVVDRGLHEVRERDYFFVAGFLFWGWLSGIGLGALWGELNERLQSPRRRLLTAPILILAFVPLGLNWRWASRANDFAARDWAYNLLTSVEPYGVLFTNGDNDTFPLWYLQEVEGIRRDVTVVVVQYLWTDWYPKQLQELTRPENQREFVPASAASPHRPPSRVPSAPITSLTHEELDAVFGGRFDEEFTVTLGDVVVVYPAGTSIGRAQLLALAIIRDSVGERPIHFASRAGLMSDLGLTQRGIRHGITTSLHLRDPSEVAGVVQIDPALGGDWVDVDRSLTLARDVYSYRGLRDRDVWTDRATLNIPWHFYALHLQLQDAARRSGLSEDLIQELGQAAEAFRIVAQGGRLGTPS